MDAIIANANDNNIEIEDFEKTAHGVDVDRIPPPTTIRRNWETMKEKWSTREANGSLGDLGTFLPLLMGLSMTQGLDLGTTLIFTGAYNVVTGFLFGIPMPLQPMKTIAAVALSEKPLSLNEVIAAGIFVSICVFIQL